MQKIKIYPSLISGDLLNLERQVKELESHCDGFHIDVMDDHFVPNLTWGPQFVNAIAKLSKKPLDVHLMVEDPLAMIERLALKEGSIIAFHIEAVEKVEDVAHAIKEKKLMPSIAISPGTSIEKIASSLQYVEQVLLMSVNPGFSGQAFLPDSFERLDQLVVLRKKSGKNFVIAMDGGINKNNIASCVKHGATSFGIASGVFSQQDPVEAIKELYLCGLTEE